MTIVKSKQHQSFFLQASVKAIAKLLGDYFHFRSLCSTLDRTELTNKLDLDVNKSFS